MLVRRAPASVSNSLALSGQAMGLSLGSVSAPAGSNPAPAFLQAQTVRTWAQPFTNTPTSVAPSPVPPGSSGYAGKFAWGGGRVTQAGIRLFGGGDNDYGGNDEQLGTLTALSFSTIRNPSTATGGTVTTYADGQVRPPHTYRYYVATSTHVYLCCMSGPFEDTGTYLEVWKRALPTSNWQFVTTLTGTVFGPMLCGAVYSSTRNRIYIFSAYGEPWVLNPTNDSVTHPSIPGFVAGADAGNGIELIDQANAVAYLSANGNFSLINLDDLAAGWSQQTVSGTFGVSNYPGLAWHKRSKKLVGWGHSSNRDRLYTLAPPTANPTQFSHLLGTWPASFVSMGGLTPSAPTATGTHGRFGIIEYDEVDAAVLINAVDEEPYVGALNAL